MNIPPADDQVWSDIVTDRVTYDFDYLVAKVLQSSLACTLRKDPSAANLQKCCEILRELFVRNAAQPQVQKDLLKITAKEAPGGT